MKRKSFSLEFLGNHAKPVTRRDFVSLGLMSAGGLLVGPTVLQMLLRARNAEAASPGPAEFSNLAPAFLTIDCAGGAGFPGNFLVGGVGGPTDLLSSYGSLGWNPIRDRWDDRFGLPMAKEAVSQLFSGLTTTLSAEAQKNFRMGSFIHTSRDDTGDNPLSLSQLVASSFVSTSLTSTPMGTRMGSGGNSRSLIEVPGFESTQITAVDDLNALSSLVPAFSQFGEINNRAIMDTVKKLSAAQAANLLSAPVNDPRVLAITDQYELAAQTIAHPVLLDPRKIAEVKTVYGINETSAATDESVLQAGIVHATLKGYCGPGVITIGGCDYHTGSSVEGDAADLRIGQAIGRAVQLAYVKTTPFYSPDYRRWCGFKNRNASLVVRQWRSIHECHWIF